MAEDSKSTQEFIPIKEIRDGLVILKDNTLCMILLASSLNFALKSPDEQTGIILQYQNLLNSLDFPIQFYIQSRRLDIRPYIALLESRLKDEVNELLKLQITEYIKFVKNFTETTNIMTKSFFVVIPYTPAVLDTGISIPLPFFKKKDRGKRIQEKEQRFEEYRTQLEQRASIVEQGLVRFGVRSVQLGTEELIELFYKIFNPGEQDRPIATQ